MAIPRYNTYTSYPNESGFNQIAYPIRDAIPIINPFLVMLFGIFFVLSVSSYYVFTNFSGKARYFNSILSASFATTVISVFLALAGWITPYGVLIFITITVISFALVIFYK